ncbi:MAG: RNA-processing protein, partial [Desulfurococcaceae archaeon]
GKARRVLEELTGTHISIYEPYVVVIGDYETASIAKKAVEMLVEGRAHSTVYKYVDQEMFALKRKRVTELWKKGEL